MLLTVKPKISLIIIAIFLVLASNTLFLTRLRLPNMDFGEHYWKHLTIRLLCIFILFISSEYNINLIFKKVKLTFSTETFQLKIVNLNSNSYLFNLKDVDVIPFLMVQDFDSLKHMEISAVIWIDPVKLLQPWPDEQSRLEVTIRPFQSEVCII